MRYFLGVDVGASKTHGLITDEYGHALGFGASGSGNHQNVGYDGLRDVLLYATSQALGMADLTIDQISAAGFGIGGYDWPSQLKDHLNAIMPIGLKCPVEVVNDSIIGLLAGASQGWGLVLIAGTGNNCRGRDRSGREARITGEGARFGEFGGAGDLVDKAVQAVSHQWSQRGPKTILSKIFIELTGAKDLDDLIEGIDLGCYEPDASWAPTVFQAAYGGDEVAREAVAWSGRELAESACGVIRQLGFQDMEFEIIMAGSVFSGGDLYIEPMQETIHKVAPGAQFVKLEVPPVVGGVVLAMQKINLPTIPLHITLTESSRKFIQEVIIE
jgi:N-acetylglucosamine kinase-like BadF-type ATPase